MTVSVLQVAKAESSSSVTTLAATFASPVTAGSSLVCVGWASTNYAWDAISDNKGGSWTARSAFYVTSVADTIGLWECISHPGGSGTQVTIDTGSPGASMSIMVLELAGEVAYSDYITRDLATNSQYLGPGAQTQTIDRLCIAACSFTQAYPDADPAGNGWTVVSYSAFVGQHIPRAAYKASTASEEAIWTHNAANCQGGGIGVTYIPNVAVDQCLPDADVVTTGWTTAPLFSKVNDASDATVIQATAS